MKKSTRVKSFNYLSSSSAESFFEENEMTVFSESNPFFQKLTTTDKKEKNIHNQETRKEYWPFLEPL